MADILFCNVKGVDFGFILNIYRLHQNLYTRERGVGGIKLQISHNYLILVTLKLRNMFAFFFEKENSPCTPCGLIRPCALIDFRILSCEQECTMYERVSSSHLNWFILWRCGWCKARTVRMG